VAHARYVVPLFFNRNIADALDFGFFSWPEPGVGAYTEVRDKAKAFETDLGLMMDANGTVETSSWDRKEAKLMWRGVPMVDVRQVRFPSRSTRGMS
jgi:hypothetical protein